jgi:hypothetical protein
MIYRLSADLVLIIHLAFVLFVLLGGVLVLRWGRLLWLHLAAVFWAVLIEFVGIICPLTPLELALRQRAGQPGYEGDFIEHYVTALLYPAGLTRELQIWFGFAALLPNVLFYGYLVVRRRRPSA